jgi:hypothetical protein
MFKNAEKWRQKEIFQCSRRTSLRLTPDFTSEIMRARCVLEVE